MLVRLGAAPELSWGPPKAHVGPRGGVLWLPAGPRWRRAGGLVGGCLGGLLGEAAEGAAITAAEQKKNSAQRGAVRKRPRAERRSFSFARQRKDFFYTTSASLPGHALQEETMQSTGPRVHIIFLWKNCAFLLTFVCYENKVIYGFCE